MKIVWLIVDALRRDHVGCYGNQWLKSPNIDRLASCAQLFSAAHSYTADCRAVRVELLSGISSARIDRPVSTARSVPRQRSLVNLLRNTGYRTGLITDNRGVLPIYNIMGCFDFVVRHPGQADNPEIRQPGDLADVTSTLNGRPMVVSQHAPSQHAIQQYLQNHSRHQRIGHPTKTLFETASQCIAALPTAHDWFVIIDSFAVLPPWDAPRDFAAYRPADQTDTLAWLDSPRVTTDQMSEDQLRFLRCAYADSCEFLDHALAPFVETLDDVEDTYLFFMSDHGTAIGDDEYVGWDRHTHTPAVTDQVLLVVRPDHSCGRDDDDIVPADVHATTLELAGVEPTERCDSKSINTIMH